LKNGIWSNFALSALECKNGMFLPLLVLNGVMHVSDEALAENAKKYVEYVFQPSKIVQK